MPVAMTAAAICLSATVMRVSSRRTSPTRSTATVPQHGLTGGARPHPPLYRSGGCSPQLDRLPAVNEPREQHMQPVHGLGALLDQVVTVINDGAQRDDRVRDLHRPQLSGVERG